MKIKDKIIHLLGGYTEDEYCIAKQNEWERGIGFEAKRVCKYLDETYNKVPDWERISIIYSSCQLIATEFSNENENTDNGKELE